MVKEVKKMIAGDLAKYIGMQVRLRRIQCGMTQKQLEEATGIRQATLSLLEKGEVDVRLSTLAMLRTALALDIKIEPCSVDNMAPEDIYVSKEFRSEGHNI